MTEFRKFPHVLTKDALLRQVDYFKDNFVSGEYRVCGTVKLHGTNAAIVFHEDGTLGAQSRSRMLSPDNDHYGFAAWVASLGEDSEYRKAATLLGATHLYGEWVGKGVQSKVAVSKLARQFVAFAYRDEEGVHPLALPISGLEFPQVAEVEPIFHTFQIDSPDTAVEAFRKLLETAQEDAKVYGKQCPYGKLHGVEGPGEGLVWSFLSVPPRIPKDFQNSIFYRGNWMFKTKSNHHKITREEKKSKKQLSKVDPDILMKLWETTDSQSRVLQGIQNITEEGCIPGYDHIASFASWFARDVTREWATTISETPDPALYKKKLVGKAITKYKEELGL